MEFDMLAEARNAQWTKDGFMGQDALRVISPAKINLFLAIGAKRPNGYHDVVNVMHALAMHDVLYIHCRKAGDGEDDVSGPCALGGPAENLTVSIEIADKTESQHGAGDVLDIPLERNLVFKAADQLAKALDRTDREILQVRIEKHVPPQAGLGGGSANAAATLIALAELWDIPDAPEIEEVAKTLGADVAFFLQGGCALYEGVGEEMIKELQPMKQAVVIVKPRGGVPTAEAYAAFDADPLYPAESQIEAVRRATEAIQVPLFNGLEHAAETVLPELEEIRVWLTHHARVDAALLCGSGAATFALVEDFETASRVSSEALARGWWSRPTTLSALRAAIVGS